MRAVWYDRQGPASEVLQVGEVPDPEPGPGEVRVRVSRSGVNPGDTKKRRGWLGSSMAFPRVIPHSDGAGVIDSAGPGVDPKRVGQRVWIYGAQSYRPFGTAAQFTVVPDSQAIELPGSVSDDLGACLGIPGITAHRAVFGDGPVSDKTILVQGVLGAVGALAAQLARWTGATVIGTVRSRNDLAGYGGGAGQVVALDEPDPAAAIRSHAPAGVDRIIEVAFSDNVDLDAAVAKNETVIAAYATRKERPEIPFRMVMLFNNITIRLLGSDDFSAAARQQAARDLTAAAQDGALSVPIDSPIPLDRTAQAPSPSIMASASSSSRPPARRARSNSARRLPRPLRARPRASTWSSRISRRRAASSPPMVPRSARCSTPGRQAFSSSRTARAAASAGTGSSSVLAGGLGDAEMAQDLGQGPYRR